MRALRVLPLALALTASLVPTAAPTPAVADDLFENRIRPVLARHCHACHAAARMGGLRLDSGVELLKGGKSGPAVVPGDPDASLLIQAVRHTHPTLRMPLDGAKLQAEEIDDLAAWVRAGARWPENAAAPAAAAPRGITAAQRAFWAFQPVRKPEPPAVKRGAWPRTPIDRFVLAALEARGIEPAPAADRRTLIRRLTFDLHGLPPSPDEVDAFVSDRDPRALAKLVDRLLASPRYGERWGRYWLDVARYSDDKLDPTGETPYESSFRYRDWVIRAFNDDMPYDLFVKAQIAGDQLDAEQPEKYVPGLGFYALSPQFQDDRVDATTRGFLGLTVACAQCHDHKFDPIPTRDYYSILGVFKSTEAHDYPLAAADAVAAYDAHKKRVEKQEEAIKEFLKAQASQLAEILAGRAARYLGAAARSLSDPKGDAQAAADSDRLDRETLDRWVEYLKKSQREHPFLDAWSELVERRAPAAELERAAVELQGRLLSVAAEKKEVDEKNLITLGGRNERNLLSSASLVSLERDRYFLWRDFFSDRGVLYYGDRKLDRFLSGEWKAHLESLRAELVALKSSLPSRYPFLHAVRDLPQPRNLKVEIRGNSATLGEEAPRRFLEILCEGAPKPFTRGSGRLELAEAIASRTNPLTARVMANRIWQHHFGQGIVRTASNFGALGDRPSHPELLDYLASYLVEQNWSIKAMHRHIVTSAAYLQSARHSEAAHALDPENRLLWRFSRRRLDVEALRDTLLAVSGSLETTTGGIARRLDDDNRRRTVYGFVSRKKLDPMLQLFDFANPNNTSEARIATNVPLQRLFLANSPFMVLRAREIAARLAGSSAADRIASAYRILFGRAPSKTELRLGLDFVAGGQGSSEAWEAYAQVLVSSNEFLSVE